MRNLILLCSVFLLGCTHTEVSATDIWATFVESPTADNEQQLIYAIGKDIDGCGWGRPENQIVIPDRFRQDLFDLIADGNTSSYRVGLRIEKCLDGGDLGDFKRSAGLFFDVKPKVFIDESKQAGVSPERFADLITKLPLALTDDPRSQRDLVNERIGKLQELQTFAEAQMSEKGLSALRKLEQSLSEVIEEQG